LPVRQPQLEGPDYGPSTWLVGATRIWPPAGRLSSGFSRGVFGPAIYSKTARKKKAE